MRKSNLDKDDIYILKNICVYWQLYESAAKYRDMESMINDEYSIDTKFILLEIKELTIKYQHIGSNDNESYKKTIGYIIEKYKFKNKEKVIDILTELLHIGISNNLKYFKEVFLSQMRKIQIDYLLNEDYD